ncbi:hypothetical protein [Zoogloea sp.]|uniref:hypothetical protein n=1 Tax=Zoogloea sp. TaxID=49181 RepID=UPI0035AFC852
MLKIYEIAITLVFLAVLGWALRSRSPINLGAVLGGFMLWGFDWLWCSRGFWNATTAADLIMIPGLEILGIRYPISICFVWGVGFGFIPLIASKAHDQIALALGRLHFPVILVVAILIDLVVEAACISVFRVWTYHQAPEYLLLGVVWSNTWFLGGVLAASYFGLARVQRWAEIPDSAGFALSSEATWKGVLMGAAAVLLPAFLLGTLQLFWWSATHPWVESGRLF